MTVPPLALSTHEAPTRFHNVACFRGWQRRAATRALLGLWLLVACPWPGAAQGESVGSLHMAPEFEAVYRQIVSRSPTVWRQQQRLLAAPRLRVYVCLVSRLPGDRAAQAVFRPNPLGGFDAWIDISSPLRMHEYAELVAHEFEHVIEQLDGVNLAKVSYQRDGGVSRLADGSFETRRAVLVGRQASRELLVAGRRAPVVVQVVSRAPGLK